MQQGRDGAEALLIANAKGDCLGGQASCFGKVLGASKYLGFFARLSFSFLFFGVYCCSLGHVFCGHTGKDEREESILMVTRLLVQN